MKTLHLTIKRKWFDMIASGEKKIEYRETKRYWDKRLLGREYDEVYFRNGYSKNAPFMRVKYLGFSIRCTLNPDTGSCGPVYCIHLGDVLEVGRAE